MYGVCTLYSVSMFDKVNVSVIVCKNYCMSIICVSVYIICSHVHVYIKYNRGCIFVVNMIMSAYVCVFMFA